MKCFHSYLITSLYVLYLGCYSALTRGLFSCLFMCCSVIIIFIINIHQLCFAIHWGDICLFPLTTFCQADECDVIKQLTYCQDTRSCIKRKEKGHNHLFTSRHTTICVCSPRTTDFTWNMSYIQCVCLVAHQNTHFQSIPNRLPNFIGLSKHSTKPLSTMK